MVYMDPIPTFVTGTLLAINDSAGISLTTFADRYSVSADTGIARGIILLSGCLFVFESNPLLH